MLVPSLTFRPSGVFPPSVLDWPSRPALARSGMMPSRQPQLLARSHAARASPPGFRFPARITRCRRTTTPSLPSSSGFARPLMRFGSSLDLMTASGLRLPPSGRLAPALQRTCPSSQVFLPRACARDPRTVPVVKEPRVGLPLSRAASPPGFSVLLPPTCVLGCRTPLAVH